MAKGRTVRIGGASAFWGDTDTAPHQLVHEGAIDYLIFDYLAEITMSILARARARDPDAGYARDFVDPAMASIVREVVARGIKIISNAGGMNPEACRRALEAVAREAGAELKIAVVLGDDLGEAAADIAGSGVRDLSTGAPWPGERVMSVNAYLGALPIAAALDAGADVVITGRCVDSALALGPLIHAFGWARGDYDLLAAGTLVGHILECGAQATGGIFTDWEAVERWDEIGFPIAECAPDGTFTVTKPPGTGGLVTPATVAEQMVYEIGDPAAYIVPDVTCDFTSVSLEQAGADRVRVTGARGRAPTGSYKVSATYRDGYRATAMMTLAGRDAAGKAERVAGAILARTRRRFAGGNLGDYRDTNLSVIGAESMYGPNAAEAARATREVMLRIDVHHDEAEAVKLFAREIAPAATGMAPSATGFVGGRPSVTPVVRLFSFLWPKAEMGVTVDLDGEAVVVEIPADGDGAEEPPAMPADAVEGVDEPSATVPLERLAWARSGDKGDDANIGVIARRPEYLPVLRGALTEAAVAAYFAHLLEGPVECYEWPGIHALNFVLHHSLGGGGTASLRNDPQGKAYAQMLLDLPVRVPASWGL